MRNSGAGGGSATKCPDSDSSEPSSSVSNNAHNRAPLSAANKVTNVVFEFFLPIADTYFPRYTPFTVSPDVEEQVK